MSLLNASDMIMGANRGHHQFIPKGMRHVDTPAFDPRKDPLPETVHAFLYWTMAEILGDGGRAIVHKCCPADEIRYMRYHIHAPRAAKAGIPMEVLLQGFLPKTHSVVVIGPRAIALSQVMGNVQAD